MTRTGITGLLILIIIIVGGFFTYDYLKKKPPGFLIQLFTKTAPPPALPQGDRAPLEVRDDFIPTVFSREVPGARDMTRDPRGVMLVSLTKDGKVVALNDADNDGRAETPKIVIEGLKQPHGILTTCEGEACTLYVAETDALKSYSYNSVAQTAEYKATLATFPSGDGHFTRTLLMHPDGKRLLVSVGSSCNVCNETEQQRASIVAIDLTTNTSSIFAKGLRNSVFLAIHPVTGDIWATENGRDLIGDDIPPDEVNIVKEGGYYGWPICYGQNVYDADFNARPGAPNPCQGFIPAHIDLQAHSAALGIGFIPEEGWPEELWHDVLVAYHGSWNRNAPTGYKVVRFDLDNNGKVNGGPYDFVAGFLAPGAAEDEAIGRPVDVLIEPGGTFYVSDDRAGAIYRMSWNPAL